MVEITLSKGAVAIIDDEDEERVKERSWYFDGRYACGGRWDEDKNKRVKLYLHRFLMNPPVGLDIDHIDRNKLNCQKNNLRICTRSVNIHNKIASRHNPNKLKGAFKEIKAKRWYAMIVVEGKSIKLGRFPTEQEAHQAYLIAEKLYYPII